MQTKEQQWIEDSIQEAVSHIEKIVSGDWQVVMNEMHKFNAAEKL